MTHISLVRLPAAEEGVVEPVPVLPAAATRAMAEGTEALAALRVGLEAAAAQAAMRVMAAERLLEIKPLVWLVPEEEAAARPDTTALLTAPLPAAVSAYSGRELTALEDHLTERMLIA